MRACLALATGVAALALFGVPATAGGFTVEVAPRAHYVHRFWGPRETWRFSEFREHGRLSLGPRYHYRIQRPGFDLQRSRSAPPLVPRHEPIK